MIDCGLGVLTRDIGGRRLTMVKLRAGKSGDRVRRTLYTPLRVALLTAIGLTSLTCLAVPALATCKITKLVEMPITMSGPRPLLTAKINDTDVQFVVDSGAFYSTISAASAAQLKLRLNPTPPGFKLMGINGRASASLANVKVLTIFGVPIPNVEFLVGGGEVGNDNVGLLGQNFLRTSDVEYDLANGVIRLMRTEKCEHTLLAYWAAAANLPYSLIEINRTTALEPHTIGAAFLNGTKIRVLFDTGASASILSLKAAERAGIKPDSAGVVDAGNDIGIGRGSVKTYLGRFASFKIGDEEIRNAQLRFGEMTLDTADMLLGEDFFLSHRIYVSNDQHELFFTYNGGPVFNLARGPAEKPTAGPVSDKDPSEPVNAAGFSQRGNALAARRDFERALHDLSRACELAPDNAEYFYQRGSVYRETRQAPLALADFDRAIELKPDDVRALMARAALRLEGGDTAGAIADFDTVDRFAPKEADLRLSLAEDYARSDRLAQSIAQYDLWIQFHREDARLGGALDARCWATAMQGEDLSKAQSDCSAALKLAIKGGAFYASILEHRGFVRLRLGDYEKSIADYDDSLKLAPEDPWSLYGRGIAKLRRQKTVEGQADLASATKLMPSVGDEFARRGINP
jgi:tetratricopeptide (TPR) repeat protein